MKTRKLLNGTEVPELDVAVTLAITTKCPDKWTLIDNETGQMYTGHLDPSLGNPWRKIENPPRQT